MATNGLYPAFVRFYYTTIFGQHTATHGTRSMTYDDVGDDPTLTAWDGSTIVLSDMIDDTVTAWAEVLPTGTTIDYYDAFVIEEIGGVPLFVTSGTIGVAGTTDPSGAGRARAVQHMLEFKATSGGLFKWVSLDRPSGDFFGKSTSLSGDETTLKNYLIGDTHAWAARDDGRPSFFRRLCVTLNDRLMRSYGEGS